MWKWCILSPGKEAWEWVCECGNHWATDGTRTLTRKADHICSVPVPLWRVRRLREESYRKYE